MLTPENVLSHWYMLAFLLLAWLPAFRIKRLHHIAAFIISYLAFHHMFIAVGQQHSFYLNLFFPFVLLIEPITAPASRNGRILHGALIGLLAVLLAETVANDLYALAIANLLTPAINKFVK